MGELPFMPGPPVTIAPNGLPITPVQEGAPVLSYVESGGAPVTITPFGTPFILSGYNPDPPPWGPLDYANPDEDAFTDFSREYDLQSSSAVLGFVCDFTGDPVIEIAHGGEPLTIVRQDRNPSGILTLLAVGTGLTVETANLTIKATGGNLHGGAVRINEMINIDPALVGWTGGATGASGKSQSPAMSGTQGGVAKVAWGGRIYDPSIQYRLGGAEQVFAGFLETGEIRDLDYGPIGDWTIGAGWSWDGLDLVHAGPELTEVLLHFTENVNYYGGARIETVVADGARVILDVYEKSTSSRRGPFDGPLYNGVAGRFTRMRIQAEGEVRVTAIRVIDGARNVTWRFGTAPAEDGKVFNMSTTASPAWAISVAEVLGEDY